MSSNIVLIGNGPSVMDREAGEEIDSFDTVIRFNNYETKDFEKYVGTKTDVWWTRICSTIRDREFDGKVVGVINNCKWTSGIKLITPKFKQRYPQAEIVDNKEVKRYADTFGYDPDERWLSVGMICIMHLLDNGFNDIHLYGFGGDIHSHYYKLNPSGEEHHNFDHEKQRRNIFEGLGVIEVL